MLIGKISINIDKKKLTKTSNGQHPKTNID